MSDILYLEFLHISLTARTQTDFEDNRDLSLRFEISEEICWMRYSQMFDILYLELRHISFRRLFGTAVSGKI